MSVAAVISDIDLVGEQIFDHTPLIRKEIEKFLNNFERNERHKEFDGIIRASHSLVEATDTTLESLIAEGALERLNEEIKSVADAVTSLTVPTFKQEHDDYLESVKRNQAEQIRIVDTEVDRQRRALRERSSREGTADSLTSPDMSTTSEVDLN
uniref:Biogenesis of lysosome-related organelles complex 1 subunit 5 n=1 Tax=Ascaris lumbricoides TaxID=6252 RepID=A0A0M3HPL3_ASCLU